MDLDRYDEDNPNLDGDYKAVLKRRREIAQHRKVHNWELTKSLASFVTPKDTTNAAEQLVSQDHRIRQELRDALFRAADDGQADVIRTLLNDVKKYELNLCAPVLRQDSGETLLHRALLQGNDPLADLLINAGGQNLVLATYFTEVDGNQSTNTCLHVASEFGSLETVKRLVQSVPGDAARKDFLLKTALVLPEGQRARNLTCLHIAAKAGKTDMVKYYIVECRMDVNLKNSKNDSPLLWAASDGRTDVVELLISLGARVDEQNDKGSSALHWAVRFHHLEVIEALLKNGKANVNIRRKLGLVCPLVMASAMAFDDVVKLLIKYGVDVNARIHVEETALHYAAGEGATEVCQTLIKAGASVNSVDGEGETPLLQAAKHGHVETVALLVRLGANVQHMNKERLSVWNYAVNAAADTMLDVLLQLSEHWQDPLVAKAVSSKSIRTRSPSFPEGYSPLHVAAEKGDASKIALMLRNGIDIACRDNRGNTMLHVASMHNHSDIVQQYCDEMTASMVNTDGNTPLHLACQRGNTDCILILTRKTKLQTANGIGMTVLHEAAKSKHIDALAVGFLITQVIQSHDWSLLDSQDKSGNTALHLAVSAGNMHVVQALKPLSAKVSNSAGNTPLHLAVMKRDEAIFMQLLEDRGSLGKEIFDVLNSEGMSILNLAIQQKHTKNIENIISAGADIGLRCLDGNTAFHIMVNLMIDEVDSRPVYLQIAKMIVSKCHIWWAARLRIPIWHDDSAEQRQVTQQASAFLFTEIVNDDGLNVLQYAARKGCAPLVQYILNLPHVFRRHATDQSDAYVYDVTGMTPATLVLLPQEGKRNGGAGSGPAKNQVDLMQQRQGDGNAKQNVPNEIWDEATASASAPPRRTESLLELIVSNENLQAAAQVLDTEPVRSVVKQYWTTYQWLFGFVMFLHLLHMSLLSYFGPTLMAKSLSNCSAGVYSSNLSSVGVLCSPVAGSRDTSVVVVECVVLVAPSALLLYEALDLALVIKAKVSAAPPSKAIRPKTGKVDFTPLGVGLLRMCGVGHALLAFGWYIAYRLHVLDQDYLLAVALVLGWLFSINYTRGFKVIHNFNLMLRHMIFRDVAKFLVFYAFLLLGFGMAQYTMIRSDPSNSALGYGGTLFTLFQWLIGMSNFWSSGSSEPNSPPLLYRYAFEGVLYIVYCTVTTVVLVNLLIATMSDSYSEVRDSSALFWKVNSIEMAIDIEKFVPPVTRAIRKLRRGQATLRYNDEKRKWLCTVDARLLAAAAAATGGDDDLRSSVSHLDEKVSDVQKELRSLRLTLEQSSSQASDNRPKLLKALANALAGKDAAGAGGGGGGGVLAESKKQL